MYGEKDKYNNVYDILISVINNRKKIKVSNDKFGDPIPGTVKKLIVHYDDGSVSIFKENSFIFLNNYGALELIVIQNIHTDNDECHFYKCLDLFGCDKICWESFIGGRVDITGKKRRN